MAITLIILEQALLHFPLILGAYISISLMKVPDLSIESAYLFGAICATNSLIHMPNMPLGLSIFIVLLASLCGGIIVGLTSSFLTQKIYLPHLLSSIVTLGLFHGINQFMLGTYISLSNYLNPLSIFNNLAHHPELPILILIFLTLLVFGYLFFKTQLGYAIVVYGNNPQFFTHYNIDKSYVFIAGIVISNALAGLSGYLFAQSNNFVELNMGFGKALFCITSLVMGKALSRTDKPCSILVPIFGMLSYFFLQQLLLKAGFNLKYFTAVQAVIVLILLASMHKKSRTQNSIDHLGV